MRPLLAILVSAAILGGVQAYMASRPKPKATEHQEDLSAAKVEVEIETTFDAEPDPFQGRPALSVEFRGKEMAGRLAGQTIQAGRVVTVALTEGVAQGDELSGQNEITISANPAPQAASTGRALRVKIYRDGALLKEEVVWSEGSEISRSITFTIRK